MVCVIDRERRDVFGTVPPAMSGTCGCVVNEELYIFGGCCDDGQTNEVKLCSVFTVFRCISKASQKSLVSALLRQSAGPEVHLEEREASVRIAAVAER